MKKEEISSEKSQLPVKLTIRRKGFEISTEGTISALVKELEALSEFTDKVSEKLELLEEFPVETEPAPSAEELAGTPSADIPAISASRRTIDNLQALFNTPWGRTPRTLAEVIKALEINAVPDTPAAVSRDLARLVQRGVLRRIEKEGKYAYYRLPP
jgi:DNA-binding transcriptional ArsR family regulator